MNDNNTNDATLSIFTAAIHAVGIVDNLDDKSMSRYCEDVFNMAVRLNTTYRKFQKEAQSDLGTMKLTGKIMSVDNPHTSESGNKLDLCLVILKSDNASKYNDRIWVNLRTAEGRKMAARAERLVGKRVSLTKRMILDLAPDGSIQYLDNGKVARRNYLVELNVLDD